MADLLAQSEPRHLYGVVDMGSNGIRFSISTLQPPTARIMPTLYQHRAAISLYDAQYSTSGQRQPINETTIANVVQALKSFKRTCQDFDVPPDNITILATEATRTAINSDDFRQQIKDHTGWTVTMLPKDAEGRVGAMGIASSLSTAVGLVMDLGGGSTQLSWLVKRDDTSEILMPPSGAVSMPYGAAALSRRLAEAQHTGTVETLKNEIKQAILQAFTSLQVPPHMEELAAIKGGYSLYLSGGGFRGWGYVLMSRHKVQPYPIPVINGFTALRKDFENVEVVQDAAAASLDEHNDDSIFRVSDRRATQVPAVALLIQALQEALPQILDVRFCQGGVREGYLYSTLSPEVRAQAPLLVATQPFAQAESSDGIVKLLRSSMPDSSKRSSVAITFDDTMLRAFANLMYYHSSHSKDIQASAALRSTTTGVLAGTHGVLHEARAVLGLLLCSRWGAALSPTDEQFKTGLESLVNDAHVLWWINYLGAVASLIAECYPAGIKNVERVALHASWSKDSKDRPQVSLIIAPKHDLELRELVETAEQIEKIVKHHRQETRDRPASLKYG